MIQGRLPVPGQHSRSLARSGTTALVILLGRCGFKPLASGIEQHLMNDKLSECWACTMIGRTCSMSVASNMTCAPIRIRLEPVHNHANVCCVHVVVVRCVQVGLVPSQKSQVREAGLTARSCSRRLAQGALSRACMNFISRSCALGTEPEGPKERPRPGSALLQPVTAPWVCEVCHRQLVEDSLRSLGCHRPRRIPALLGNRPPWLRVYLDLTTSGWFHASS